MTIKTWDTATGHLIQTLRGHKNWVTAVAVSPSGRRIASASLDCTIRLWDAESGQELIALTGHPGPPFWDVAFSPDGHTIASASDDGLVRLWDGRPYEGGVR